MLEFLGLEEEASRVILCFLIIGISVGLPSGGVSASGRKKDDGKTPVVMVIGMVIAVIAFLVGLLPGIVLFFTFQWNVLLGGLFLALAAGAVCFGLGYFVVLSHRKGKYKRNPIMKEAVAYCRRSGVVGVQCFGDRLRFHKELADADYCKTDTHMEMRANLDQSVDYQTHWTRPDSWIAYDQSSGYAGDLTFAKRDYPDIPDLELFAKVLASRLGGCGIATHTRSVQYDTVTRTAGTTTRTHHITHLYRDCFVYKKSACRRLREQQAQREKALRATAPAVPVKKENTWE